VYVVDEQGNEYEATYPKRAKGLVKKGRARFIAENKICLACPPDQILEEQTMENTNTVTVKEIFDQIVALQKDMIGNSGAALYRMGDVLSSVFGDNTNVAECENLEDIVNTVCHPFSLREQTYQQMLDLYEKMYNDCKNGAQ